MIIKDKIQIGSIDFEIQFVDELKVHEDATFKDIKLMGYLDYDNQVIQLDKDVKPQLTEISFIHELIHLIFHTNGVHFKERWKHDETSVERLSFTLHQVISQIAEWQMEGTDDS